MLTLPSAGDCNGDAAAATLHMLLCLTIVTDAVDLSAHTPLRWKCIIAICT
jgi:hypothetical protein